MSNKKFHISDSFADRLNDFIKGNLKISKSEFARIVGISQSYLSMLLSHERGPSADLIASIYLHYRDVLYWLLTGDYLDNSSEDDSRISQLEARISSLERSQGMAEGNPIKKGAISQK